MIDLFRAGFRNWLGSDAFGLKAEMQLVSLKPLP